MEEEEIVLGAQAIAATGRFLAASLSFVLAILPWRPHSALGWALVAVCAMLSGGLFVRYDMRIWALIKDPLVGRSSLSAAVWGYGLLGSLIYSVLGMGLDAGDTRALHLYAIGGFLYSVYATIAVYQCAYNSRSRWIAQLARISAILSLILLLMFIYLYATGAFDGLLSSLQGLTG
jgi:hypothetical protein